MSATRQETAHRCRVAAAAHHLAVRAVRHRAVRHREGSRLPVRHIAAGGEAAGGTGGPLVADRCPVHLVPAMRPVHSFESALTMSCLGNRQLDRRRLER